MLHPMSELYRYLYKNLYEIWVHTAIVLDLDFRDEKTFFLFLSALLGTAVLVSVALIRRDPIGLLAAGFGIAYCLIAVALLEWRLPPPESGGPVPAGNADP